MAEIEWKAIKWKAAYGDHSIRDLLTILKGFGPMEVLEFEKPDCFRGQLSVSATEGGGKGITIYYLETMGSRRTGAGRAALKYLRDIFKGEVYVEDPGGDVIKVSNPDGKSLLFWIGMFREGLIDALESETCLLEKGMCAADRDRIEREVRSRREMGSRRRAEAETEDEGSGEDRERIGA